MADIARLTDLIAHEAETLGFELVRVRLMGTGENRTLQVMAEDPATGQMIMEQCAQLSRAISAKIDTIEESGEELVEGAYMLEVGSPGIDRPLVRPKDYANWAGHDAKISLVEKVDDRRRLVGPIIGIEGDVVTIDDKDSGAVTVRLENIHAAQLVLTDRLIAATQPLDSSGADEIEEANENEEEKA
ncbi:ribosome maturation factor RimP [Alteraurantiacibacter aestuarii]|uniref:Ribosome maturation factor RimP n=1 Tax=Alteraurantiacibacter aestuarii TaxID=650004 RepID=A0A844ZPP9_9SPHN|nr:ribosome maturation protein RimP [Alteraurantiacibacter aestuarii]MXO89026.1 ribosome maturation protein RimP [Alteraurantiacibacter aestuarii]